MRSYRGRYFAAGDDRSADVPIRQWRKWRLGNSPLEARGRTLLGDSPRVIILRDVSDQDTSDLVADLLAPIPLAVLVPAVQAVLGVTSAQAGAIVSAFDEYVAQPLEANLEKLHGRDLAKRNPMIYTVRGARTIDE